MKKAVKAFGTPPDILINATRIGHLITAIANQNAHNISNSHYAPAAVKALLEGIYDEKCSYCESTVRHVAAVQVEHYRPKNGVAEEATHNGYYWLALEWSNLVLGCPVCNGQGAKGNKFPILGDRVFRQNPIGSNSNLDRSQLLPDVSPLSNELPVLLHPEVDNPMEHLKYNAYALLEHTTERGEGTIRICRLNRADLVRERQRVINELLEQCNIIFLGKLENEIEMTDEMVNNLLKYQLNLFRNKKNDPNEPYTSFREYILENFEECAIVRVEEIFKNYLRSAYMNWSRENS